MNVCEKLKVAMTQDVTIHGSAHTGLCFFRNNVEMVRDVKLALKCFSISGSQSQLVVYGGLFDEGLFFSLISSVLLNRLLLLKFGPILLGKWFISLRGLGT